MGEDTTILSDGEISISSFLSVKNLFNLGTPFNINIYLNKNSLYSSSQEYYTARYKVRKKITYNKV